MSGAGEGVWARIEAAVGAGMVAFILVVQTYSVVMRYAFARAPSWAEELSSYALVGVVMLTLGRVLRRRGHLRINVVRNALSPRARRWLDVATTSASIAYVVALIWGGSRLALDAWQVDLRSESSLQAPLWLPYLIVPLGAIVLLASMLGALVALLKRAE